MTLYLVGATASGKTTLYRELERAGLHVDRVFEVRSVANLPPKGAESRVVILVSRGLALTPSGVDAAVCSMQSDRWAEDAARTLLASPLFAGATK